MKPPLIKPCSVCGNPVVPYRRMDRSCYSYPKRCPSCFRVIKDVSCHSKKGRRGNKHPKWSGGKHITNSRNKHYFSIWTPNGRRYEHRLVMEQHLGRPLLKTEIVHHKDGNGLNNDISNLEIISIGYHQKLHLTGKRIADPQICAICGKEFYRPPSQRNGKIPLCSRLCVNVSYKTPGPTITRIFP